ncbi:MAG: ferrous iron transport protein B [Ignavibacteriales bacterium]|nr:ferrous iron transport protein B [Ignavibacteriales bacterium]
MKSKIVVALAGNPNSGKTTIFNNITGARQHVGNYPGVTVELKEGNCKHNDTEIEIIDLPGTYSLTAYSAEEAIARNFIIDSKPDAVVNVIDASNLERNLYLSLQLLELGVPLVLAFNMSDVAKSRGYEFDIAKLSSSLNAPIVPTVGHKNGGMKELLDAVVTTAKNNHPPQKLIINYGKEIETEISKIQSLIDINPNGTSKYDSRWLAVKLLEDDKEIAAKISSHEVTEQAKASGGGIEKELDEHPQAIIADKRYNFITDVCNEAVKSNEKKSRTLSDIIDSFATNRFFGLPIFLLLMYLVFQLTFTLGDPFMGWIEEFFVWLGETITTFWPKGSESALKSLLVDGIIGGVGGVIVFLPNILLLFLSIAILEDSGYMARAAFIMDRLMHKIGLHGKSFIPMLIGFGCSVPAIMATRTLENRRDRLATMLVIPLMSCGARLPIYALIIPAFFPQQWHAPMLWLIYVIGIVIAIFGAKLLRSTILKGDPVPFVMELPPYRIPTLKGIMIHMWERGWLYLRKAGTIILGISIILWAMTSFPKKSVFEKNYDGESAAAEETYFSEINELGKTIGISAENNSSILVDAARAELKKDSEQENFYEDEAGSEKAENDYQSTITRLTNSESGKTLALFLETKNKINETNNSFNETIEESGIEEGSPEFQKLEEEHTAALNEIEKNSPQIFSATVQYLDVIKTKYNETLVSVEQEKQSEQLAYSITGRIGHVIAPLLSPMGFDWKIGTALIGALAAKEVFVAQMGIVYSVGEADETSQDLRARLHDSYSPLTAFVIMLFCLISAPCMATIAVTKRESNSWKWALFQLGGLTALAYILTTIVYRAGLFFNIGI